MRNITKNLLTLAFGISVALIMIEITLRVFNPFAFRLKGDRIILPINKRYVVENNLTDRLDRSIIHTKNSLGFRGKEKPANFDDHLSIITVGGSTTECFYLSDDKTWSYLLEQKLNKSFKNVWINNAGLIGHSTFGHIILLEDYLIKIRPKIIIFLVGSNDVGREDLNSYEKKSLQTKYFSRREFLIEKSEIFTLIVNIKRELRTRKMRLTGNRFKLKITDLERLEIPEEIMRTNIETHRMRYLENYKKRLLRLIYLTKNNNIKPVLVTQPSLYGDRIDTLTGVNLGKVKLNKSLNGELFWRILDLYNDITRMVGKETGTFVIDLAHKLPKNSLYFYDEVHYTNEGARKVTEIIYEDLKKYLEINYPTFMKINTG